MQKTHGLRHVNLAVVEAFFAIVEAGSLSKAALRLRLSQSTLTRQIQTLEAEVGGKLVERGAAGVALTPAGRTFLEGMRQPCEDIRKVVEQARRVSRGQRSTLRVGYMASVAPRYLNPALRALREQNPSVKVELRDSTPSEQIAAVREGRLDVGIVDESGRLAEREFFVRRLATVPAVVLLAENHPFSRRDRISLRDLKAETFVAIPEEDTPAYGAWLRGLCRKAGFRPRFTEPAESMAHLLAMIPVDQCVAVLPQFMAEAVPNGVRALSLSDPRAVADLLVIWQRGKIAEPVRQLLHALFTAAPKLPPL